MASSVLDPSGSSPQQLPAADVAVRTACKPGNKVSCGGPPRHVAADLTEQGQRVFLYAWNLTDIYSEEFIGFGTQIELWVGMPVLPSPFASGSISFPVRWQRSFHGVDARSEPLQHLLDFQIAVYDLLLIDAVQIT